MGTTMLDQQCQGASCGKPAQLRCPTCIKMNLADAFYCDQQCFKANWATHKAVHVDPNAPYNPWPAFPFTGKIASISRSFCLLCYIPSYNSDPKPFIN